MSLPARARCEWPSCAMPAGHRGPHFRGVEPPKPGAVAAAAPPAERCHHCGGATEKRETPAGVFIGCHRCGKAWPEGSGGRR